MIYKSEKPVIEEKRELLDSPMVCDDNYGTIFALQLEQWSSHVLCSNSYVNATEQSTKANRSFPPFLTHACQTPHRPRKMQRPQQAPQCAIVMRTSPYGYSASTEPFLRPRRQVPVAHRSSLTSFVFAMQLANPRCTIGPFPCSLILSSRPVT